MLRTEPGSLDGNSEETLSLILSLLNKTDGLSVTHSANPSLYVTPVKQCWMRRSEQSDRVESVRAARSSTQFPPFHSSPLLLCQPACPQRPAAAHLPRPAPAATLPATAADHCAAAAAGRRYTFDSTAAAAADSTTVRVRQRDGAAMWRATSRSKSVLCAMP